MTSSPALMASVVREERRHPRAPLRLPVRLRWPSPLGQITEVSETLDVSRSGLLFSRRDPCPARARLWVAFPFDPALLLAQPEMPARVARVESRPAGGHLVAVEFDAPLRHAAQADAASLERRTSARVPLALPVRVRPADSPWPEESMTINLSNQGVLFSTARIYAPGDSLRMSLPYGRWASVGEVNARVVRLDRRPGAIEQQVAVVLLPPEKS